MMSVKIGSMQFEVATSGHTTEVKITQRARGGETVVTGAAQTTEVRAALKAILAFIS